VAAFTVPGHVAARVAVEGVVRLKAACEGVVAGFTVVEHVAARVTIEGVLGDEVWRPRETVKGVVATFTVVEHAAAGIAEPNCICTVAGDGVVGAPLMVG